MVLADILVALLEGGDETRVAPPKDIPANAVFYDEEEARKLYFPNDYYPPKAIEAHANGDVVIDCQVKADGHLSRCAVIEETPEGMGFGKATAILFLKNSRVKLTKEPMPPDGWWKKFRYIWDYAGWVRNNPDF